MRIKYFINKLLNSRNSRLRVSIIILIDFASLFISFLTLHNQDESYISTSQSSLIFLNITLISYVIYFLTGQYKSLIRYVGSKSFYNLILRNLVISFLLFVTPLILYKKLIYSFSEIFSFWILLTTLNSTSRLILRDLLIKILGLRDKRKRVVIYGSGSAGAQLFASLRISYSYETKLFIDDDPNLWNRSFNGIKIKPLNYLKENKKKYDLILLAIPSLKNNERSRILENLQNIGLPILQIPSLDELTNGREINNLKPFSVEDILGRPNNSGILKSDLKSKFDSSVCFITGAGGSIGSELCRSIISLNPKKLILFERNEPSLFKIEQELLKKIDGTEITLISILGCASNEKLLSRTLKNHKVDYVFHAAAYKHVPLVELNPLQGIRNNVFSTKAVCRSSLEAKVKKVILISSDKAVRPTNVMGASKRLSELVVQSFSELTAKKDIQFKTIFAIVRFGNVLGSSGSVVPTFLKQLSEGGPVTITHPEIIRYFMTIGEAANLVLQSSIYATGGEVFLLDMGKPRKIYDLAKKMILLSGYSYKSDKNPNGQIDIVFTGLRPGEKLYEELLIGKSSIKTNHHLIYKANEVFIPARILFSKLAKLDISLSKLNKAESLRILSDIVPEWASEKQIYNS